MAVTVDFSQVDKGMKDFKSKLEAAMKIFCDNGAQKMESYAKQNRPWKDQTGNARQRLEGSWEKDKDGYTLKIAHGVDYGVWLEFAHERKYAILLPTVEKVGRGEILPAFKNFLDRLKSGG